MSRAVRTAAGQRLADRARREAWGNWQGVLEFEVPAIEAEAAGGLIVIDVDGTLSDGRPYRHATARPGVQLLLDTLVCLGFEIVVWSSGGAQHAQAVCESLTLHGSARRYASKPDYPMTEADALLTIGGRPALQIDDDHTERVADWPFMEWPRYTGLHRRAGSPRTSGAGGATE